MIARSDEQITAELHVGADVYPIKPTVDGSSTIKLDSAWAPYCQSEMSIAMPDADTWAVLDPRGAEKPRLRIHHQVGGSSRDYDLALRRRQLDYQGAGLTVSLASDEALLQDLSNATNSIDTSARAHQASLRDLIGSWLLPKIGAELEAGAADADVTTTTDISNMITDPSITSSAAWPTVGVTPTFNDTSWAVAGTGSCLLASPTTADCFLGPNSLGTNAYGMQPGHTYTVSAWGNVKNVMTGSTAPNDRERSIVVFYTDPSGTHELHSPAVPNVINTPTRVSLTFTLPANATSEAIRLYHGNTVGAIRWDACMLVEGDGLETDGTPLAYFDGATAADSHYTYAWSGAANASSSARAAIIERDPDSLAWQPGQSAWDMISPVLAAAGMRLFCDEQRVWRLIGADYQTGGALTVSRGFNLASGTDTIDLENEDGWFDSVVVKYTWTDNTGAQQTRYDVALPEDGEATRTKLIERDATPYPGPGAAAYVLKRQISKGHQLNPTMVADVTARPYQPVVVVAPDTPTLTGIISAVNFNLADDTADVTTTGLTDTPDNAIILAPAGLRIIDIPAGVTINDLIWSAL